MLHVTDVPIVVICKDRIRYLDIELKSISATCPTSLQIYISNDGTHDECMLQYLTSSVTIPLTPDWQFPRNNDEWDQLMGILPDLDKVDGIKNKVNVILHNISAGTKNLGLSCKYVFEHTQAQYLIKMEDDLVFIPQWYGILVKSIQYSGCDLISGFRYFYGDPLFAPINNLVDEICRGYCGGQLMICSRNFYNQCHYVFNNEIQTIWDNDDLWIDECRKHGMKFGVLKNSVCQHMGFCTESKQKPFMQNDKLLKVDRNVKHVEIADTISQFGHINKMISSITN